MKITILREKKQKDPLNEALPAALAAAAPYIAKAIGSVMDYEPEETAEEIVSKSEGSPIKVDAHGGEFRDIKRLLQAIQGQLIKMTAAVTPEGEGEEAAGDILPTSVNENIRKIVQHVYKKNFKS